MNIKSTGKFSKYICSLFIYLKLEYFFWNKHLMKEKKSYYSMNNYIKICVICLI